MTTIEKYLPVFEAYVNGELNAVEKQAFEKDLQQNSNMHAAWIEYRAMMDAISDKEAISLRLKLDETFHRQQQGNRIKHLTNNIWFRLSAAAVIIIIMGCLLYFFCSDGRRLQRFAESHMEIPVDTIKPGPEVVLTDSLKADTVGTSIELIGESEPPVQIASLFDREEYQISPVFAELLHNVYRSGWFLLTTPEDSVIFLPGDSLVFSWETNIYEPLYFDILDRHGKVVYKHQQSITSPWTYMPKLNPAIYMYRFATKKQPVWMGVMVGG